MTAVRKTEMGKVIVSAKIENLKDLYEVETGKLSKDKARAIEVRDAMVDTGSVMLMLPKRLIQQLGLRRVRTRRARAAAGLIDIGVYQPVQLTVEGRDCITEVAELPDNCPPLIGQVPLEMLDFWIDPIQQRLVGNPEHGGEHMIDVFLS